MGCWGITALESDAGLDALGAIRTQIQKGRTLKPEDILDELKKDTWNTPVDVRTWIVKTEPVTWDVKDVMNFTFCIGRKECLYDKV